MTFDMWVIVLAGFDGAERWASAAQFMAKSITTGTEKGYEKKLTVLDEYRLSLPPHLDPIENFELCASEKLRVQELVLFYKFLYEKKGFRRQQIAAVSTALVFSLAIAGRGNKFVRSEFAARAWKACDRSTPAESRIANDKKIKNEKDPVNARIGTTEVGLIRRI